MSEFLDMLAVYYTCDAMAAIRPLTGDEFSGCMDVYEAVKRHFAPTFELAPQGTAERAAQMRDAYLGFVGWQEANAGLVEQMRGAAMARVGGELPASLH
jgi:hypothetical protein